MPYFYVTGQVNAKLLEMLEKEIIPRLSQEMHSKYTQQELESDPDLPRFTIVFDREAYSPVFFQELWDDHRIAVRTYWKNVKDNWEENDFSEHPIDIEANETIMALCEKPVELNKVPMREIRRLSSEHQTCVFTTNKKPSITMGAIYMFSRWTLENFFKYLR